MLPKEFMNPTISDLKEDEQLFVKTLDLKVLPDGSVFVYRYSKGDVILSDWLIKLHGGQLELYSTPLSGRVMVVRSVDDRTYLPLEYIGRI